MITQELKQLVVKEAQLLRKYATTREKKKIAETIKQNDGNLYMKICSNHKRRTKLFVLCAKRPYSIFTHKLLKSKYKSYKEKDAWLDFTPIEFYISQPGAKLEDLANLILS